MPPQGEQNTPPVSPEIKTPEAPAPVEAPTNVEIPTNAPATPVTAPTVSEPAGGVSATSATPSTEPVQEADSIPPSDEAWVGAVDQVIEQTKNKPYEEEEEAEGLQIKYLLKRFGKILKREK